MKWLSVILLAPILVWGATYTVSTNADSGAGSLRQAILDLNASGGVSNTININSSLGAISLASSLPAINRDVQIDGPVVSQSIQANNFRVFFINSGITTTISNIDVAGARANGGTGGAGAGGGGGGLGAGGGLFVSTTANVTVSNVTFTSCNATGGTGGAGGGSIGGGGGGGLSNGSNGSGNNGGAGGSPAGGGGGGRGGNILAMGGTGGASGGGSAGVGTNGTAGGALDGGAGGAGGSGDTYGGGGGGGQGGNGLGLGSNGGTGGNGALGGFGGGGGGGAGGGTGVLTTGTAGTGSAGGFQGGTGGNGSGTGTGGGGGGAGLGGAIFVNGTGTLTITTSGGTLFVTNSVTAGAGGAGSGAGAAGSAGSAAGLDLFLTSGGSCTFNVTTTTTTLVNPIQSNQSGSSGSLVKSGTGTLDFATNNLTNTYTGTTTINDGTLSIASNNNLGVAANTILLNTGVGVTPTLSITGAVSTARATTLSGTQIATFAIQAGASLTHSGTIGLNAANLTVNAASSTSSTLSGVISGSGGSLTKTGTGTLTVSNTGNTYSGGTTINAGTLIISSNGNLGDTAGQIALSGGTLQTNATLSSARAVSLSSTSTINTNGNDLTLSGVASGMGALTKAGTGTLFYTGTSANTYSGLTTLSTGSLTLNKAAGVNAIAGDILINGGTLNLSVAGQIANTTAMTLSSGTFNMGGNAETMGSLNFQSGTLSQGGATLTLTDAVTTLTMRDTTISGNLALTGGGSVVFDSTNNGTGVISGNLDLGGSTTTFNIADGSAATDMSLSGIVSNGGLTKTSAGRLELAGASANTFTGATTVTTGELFLNKTADLNAVAGNVLINGGTLTLNAANQIANASAMTLSSGTFNMAGNAETLGSLNFQSGTLSQGGATLTLASASTALTMRNTTISGNLALTGGGGVIFDSTNNGTAAISGNLDLGGSTTTFNIADGSAATDMSLSGVISNGSLTKTSAGRLELAGASANTFTGITTVTAGELFLNKTAGLNAVAGDVLINGGTLTLNAANQIANTAAITLGSGTFSLAGNAETIANLNFQSGTLSQGGATLTLASASTALTMRNTTISGNLALTGGGSVVFDSTNNGTATISGNLDLGGSTTTFSIADGSAATDMSLSGIVSNGAITKTSSGRLELTGASSNTYTGITTVSAGELFLNKTAGINAIAGDILINGGNLTLNAVNQIVNTSAITLSSGNFNMAGNAETLGSLNFQSGTLSQGGATLTLASAGTTLTMRNTTISGNLALTGGGSVVFDNTNDGTALISGNLDLGGSTTTFNIANGSAATDMSLSGIISNGSLTKTSAGRLELSGSAANTFTGTTTISAGELFLNKTAGINAAAGDILINGGTLTLNAANQIVNTAAITLSSGTFNMGGNAETVSSVNFQAGSLSQGGATLTLASAGTALTMRNTTISGNLALTGGGSIVFDNTNDGTALISGNLDLGGATTNFNVANGSAATDMSLSGIISNGAITKSSSGRLEFAGASSNTYTGITTITAGELFLNKTAGINAVIGSILINGGALTLNAANQIANTSAITLSSGNLNMAGNAETIGSLNFQSGTLSQGGATLTLAGAGTALTMRNTTISGNLALTGGGSIVFDNANNGTALISGNLDLGGSITVLDVGNGSAATDLSITGVISNGGITKTSSGRLELAGGTANTFTELTSVNNGELFLNKTAGINAIVGDVIIDGGTLTLNTENQLAMTSNITLKSGTFNMAGNLDALESFTWEGGSLNQAGATLTLAGTDIALAIRDVTIAGDIALTGGGSLVFDNTNNGTAIINGNVNLGGSATVLDIARGSASTDISITGVISNGSIVKNGAGILEHIGMNTYAGGTTINGGILVISSDNNLGNPAGGLTLGNAILRINGSMSSSRPIDLIGAHVIDTNGSNLLCQGPISGNGSLHKQSGGTLTLTGINVYTGGTTVSGGTLVGNTVSLQGDILNQTSVVFDQALAGTYAGNLSGTGSMTKSNTGQLILTGTNTHLGGTTVTAGILQGNTTSLQGNIANQASVVFNQTATGTYSGSITGSGSMLKQGTGVLTLSGVNNYSGGTTISAGTLQGDTQSLQGNISNQASLIFQQNQPGTYAGNLTGTGNLVKEGLSSLTLSGSAAQLTTQINLGELVVNGMLNSSVSISLPATLMGTGTITGNVTNNGKVSPGNSIGTLNIIGDYVHATGSTLEIEISPTASDLLQITGSFTIQPGSTLEILPEPGIYSEDATYTFVTAGGGILGQFSNVIYPFNGMGSLIYSLNQIQLRFGLSPFSDLVTTGNAFAVAQDLDSIPDLSADLIDVIEQLQLLSNIEDLISALNQLQPSLFKGASILQQNASTLTSTGISQHLQQNYLACCRTPKKCFQLWISPFFEQSWQTRKREELGWRGQTEMVLAGGDYSWQGNFYLGAALGFAANQIHWKHVKSKGHFQSYSGHLYGSWVSRWAYLDAIISGGLNHFSASRNIRFASLNRTARHCQNDPFAQFDAEVGGLLYVNNLQIRPFANLAYMYLWEESYSEKGANSLNLEVKASNNRMLRSELGLNFSGCFVSCKSQWIPEMKCSWIRENRFDNEKLTARFRGTERHFTVKGLYPNRSILSLGGALTVQALSNQMSVSLFYTSQLAKRYFNQSFSLEINWPL